MNGSLNRESAKIYQFPVGGRSALAGRRSEDTRSANGIGASRVNEVALAGAWYHEAAIQESKPVRDH